MRLKKMGSGFYFEATTRDKHDQFSKIAEDGAWIDVVLVREAFRSAKQPRQEECSPAMGFGQ